MFYKIFSKRVISSIIFSVFFINLFSGYGVFGNGLGFYSLPANIGKVIDKFDVGRGEKVFLIEDLHCHPKAEENIEKVLTWIKNNYGKDFNFIGLEGTKKEEIKFDKLRSLEKESIESLGKDLIKLGLINGADFYAMKNKIKVYGIEEEKIYLNSLKRLYKSVVYRNKLENLKENLEKAYARNEGYLFNDKVERILNKREENRKGRLDFVEYVKFLKSKLNYENFGFEEINRVLELDEMKKNLDASGISLEGSMILEKLDGYINESEKEILKKEKGDKFYMLLTEILYRRNIDISKNYRRVFEYINFIKKKNLIDDLALIEELEKLEQEVMTKEMGNLGDGVEFLSEMENMRLFFRYINNEASTMDVEEYEKGLKEFNNCSRKVFFKDYVSEFGGDIEKAVRNIGLFYKDAKRRNEIMTNNLLNNKARSKVSAILVGGYHAQGIKEFLRARGIGYEVILPNLEEYDGKIFYEDRIKEEARRLGLAEEEANIKNLGKDKLNLIDVFSSAGILNDKIIGLSGKDLENKLIEIINERKNFDKVREALNKYNEAKEILRKEAEKNGKKKDFEALEKELDENIGLSGKKGFFGRILEKINKVLTNLVNKKLERDVIDDERISINKNNNNNNLNSKYNEEIDEDFYDNFDSDNKDNQFLENKNYNNKFIIADFEEEIGDEDFYDNFDSDNKDNQFLENKNYNDKFIIVDFEEEIKQFEQLHLNDDELVGDEDDYDYNEEEIEQEQLLFLNKNEEPIKIRIRKINGDGNCFYNSFTMNLSGESEAEKYKKILEKELNQKIKEISSTFGIKEEKIEKGTNILSLLDDFLKQKNGLGITLSYVSDQDSINGLLEKKEEVISFLKERIEEDKIEEDKIEEKISKLFGNFHKKHVETFGKNLFVELAKLMYFKKHLEKNYDWFEGDLYFLLIFDLLPNVNSFYILNRNKNIGDTYLAIHRNDSNDKAKDEIFLEFKPYKDGTTNNHYNSISFNKKEDKESFKNKCNECGEKIEKNKIEIEEDNNLTTLVEMFKKIIEEENKNNKNNKKFINRKREKILKLGENRKNIDNQTQKRNERKNNKKNNIKEINRIKENLENQELENKEKIIGYEEEVANFLGKGNLFDKGIKQSKDKGLISKMKELFSEFLVKFESLTDKISEKFDIIKGKLNKIKDKFKKFKGKIKIDNLEIVESDEINLSSKEDEEKGIRYQMTEKMALFLEMIMDGNKDKKTREKLIEVFLHENIEILSNDDHEFALEYAGEFQKFLSNLFIDKEFKGHFDRLFNINQENKSITEKDIEEIMESVSYIVEKFNKNSSGLRLSISDVYDKFPKIKENLIKDVVKKEELKEIVIDVNGKDLVEIEGILKKLGLENKYKLRVVLVGDIKEKEKLEEYLKILSSINNPFIDIEAVLGKELLVEIRNDAKLLEKYKNIVSAVTILGNGYILTASGNINESLYAEISKKLNEKNITINEKNIARSINAGFFGEKEFLNIYENFINNTRNLVLAKNVRQFVIGAEKALGDESLLEKIINKANDKKIKMITVSDNGLVLSKSIEIDKFKNLNFLEEKDNNFAEDINILGTEKIVLEGLNGKKMDILKFGITIQNKCISFLSKIGLAKAIDKTKIKLSENVKSFAAAA